MRKLILCIAIAGSVATPLAFAQSHGGGPPAGVGGGMGGSMGGSHMGSPMGNMGSSMGLGTHADIGRSHAIDARARADLRRHNAQTPEQAIFGLSTAERAKLLKDADLETRKAFGAYQSALARAQARHDAGTTAEATAQLDAGTASFSQLNAFAADTQARASEQKNADRATRRAFGKLQSALAQEQGLQQAAGPLALNAAFGTQTAARARTQGDADHTTRTSFGAEQSAAASTLTHGDASTAGTESDSGDKDQH